MSARNEWRPDAVALARMAGPAEDHLSVDPNDTVRAEIVASVDERGIRAEVFLKVNYGASPRNDMLYWRDDFDGGG